MSTEESTGQKSGYDSDGSMLPDDWKVAGNESDSYLVHWSGASLLIRRTAPPRKPHRPADTRGHWELDLQVQPGGILLPVVQDGSRNGCRAMAEKLARRRPDAQFDDDDLAGLFEIPDEVSR